MGTDPNKSVVNEWGRQLDFVGYVNAFSAQQWTTIGNTLEFLNQSAEDQYQRAFADLQAADRHRLIHHLPAQDAVFAHDIATEIMACYYQDYRVLAALGMEPRPPYPLGHEVIAGDLSLLEPARQRGRLYRAVDD